MGIIWNVSNARAHLDGNTVVLDNPGTDRAPIPGPIARQSW